METSDTNELLSAYKKYTCIKKPHDYKKDKERCALKDILFRFYFKK